MLNKRIISLILALLMLLTTSFTALAFEPASYDAGDEMFVDGGIESASYVYGTNTTGSVGYTQDVNYVHSGSRALRFTVAGGDLMARHGRDSGNDEMNAYLQEGVVYKLSFWAKADSGSTVFTFPGASAGNPYNSGFLKDITTGSAPTAVVGSEWEKVELYITPNAGTTITSGQQYFRMQSSQIASLDDISLKPVTKYPEFTGLAIAEKNLINDPSMESQKATALAGGGWSSSYVTDVADAPNGPTVLQTNGSGESWMQAAGSYLFNGGIEAGATYSFSFWAKMATEGSTGSVTVRSAYYGGGTLLMSTSITDQWTKYTNVVTVAADSSILDFVPSGTIWFDDMNLIKLSDGSTMDLLKSSIESQKDCLPYDVDGASFTTKTLIDASTLSTVTVDNGGSVTATIDEYGYKFNVSFDTIETGTTYTLDFSGVKDIYGQSLTTASYSFTTSGRAPVALENFITDPTLEAGKATATAGSGTTTTYVTDETSPFGSKVLQISGDGGRNAYIQPHSTYLFKGGWQEGQTVRTSFWAKADTATTLTLYSRYYSGGVALVTAAATNEWTYFEGIATLGSEAAITANNGNGIITPCVNGTVVIDNFKIELLPSFGIESTTIDATKDSLSAETEGFTVTTTAALNKATLANIAIDNGATISAVMNAKDNWAFDVTLGNITTGTTYTVDLSGVKDIYGQSLTSFTFTTSGRTPAVLENFITDPTLEAGKATATAGSGTTTTYVTDETSPFGSKVLQISGDGGRNAYIQAHSTYLFKGGWQEGQTFRTSFWAKADTATTLTLYSRYYSGGVALATAAVTNEWTYFEGIATLGSEASIAAGSGTGIICPCVNGTVLIDNFKIELLPAFGIESTTIDSSKDNLSAETNGFTVTTTAALNKATLSTIAIDNGATISAVMNAEDNWAFDVTLGNITTGTTYTVDLSGVKDIYGQSLTTASYSFTTSGRAPVALENFITDPTLEAGKSTATAGSGTTTTYVTDETSPFGSKVLQISGDGGRNAYIQAHSTYLFKGGWQEGQTFRTSFWAKADTATTLTLYSRYYSGGVALATAAVTNEWTYFEGIATIGSEATIASNSGTGIICPCVSGTVLIDNFKIELLPAFGIESTTIDSSKDNLSAETNGFTVTTTAALNKATLANIAIDNGATISAVMNAEDNWAFDVTLGNIVTGTTYTVDLSGVKDIYGQSLTSFTFTTSGRAPVALTNLITDSTLEAEKNPVVSGTGYTFSYATDETSSFGSKVLKITGDGSRNAYMQAHATYLFAGNWTEGQTYRTSFWAKTESADTTATFKIYSRYYSSGVELISANVTGEWTYFEGIATIGSEATTNTTGVLCPNVSGTVLIDNFKIELLPAFGIESTTIDSSKDNLSAETNGFTVTTTAALNKATLSTIAIDNGATISAVMNAEDNWAFDVTLGNITTGTTYTVDLSGVKDIYGQSLTSFTFTTSGRAPVTLENFITDPTLEAGKSTSTAGTGTTTSYVTDETSPFGSKVLQISGDGGRNAYIQPHSTYLFKGGWQEGQTVRTSFWAKADTATTLTLYSRYYSAGVALVTADVTNEWTYFEGIATLGSEAAITANNGNGIICPCVNGTVLIDNFKIELLPAFGIESTTIDSSKDNLSAETDKFTVTTTAALNEATLSTIAIDNGATISAVMNAEDNWAFDVTLGNIVTGTTYTVDLSGVKDIYGQALTTFTFKTSGRAPVTLTNLITDSTLEAEKNPVVSGTGYTFSYATDETSQFGSKVLKITGDGSRNAYMQAHSTYLFAGNWTEGQTYRTSFWAKTESADTTATFKIYSRYYSSGVELISANVTGEWTYFEGIATIGSEATTNTTGVLCPNVSGTVLIDNFKIELLPAFGIESTTIDSQLTALPVATESFIITTTSALDEATLANIAIDNGATISASIDAVDNYAFKVSISNLVGGTTFTIDLSGVKDIYGQALTSFTFKTSGRTPYVAENFITDPTLEAGKATSTAGTGTTTTYVTDETSPFGSKVLQITGDGGRSAYIQPHSTYLFKGGWQEGQTVRTSFWAKADTATTLTLYSRYYSGGVALVTADVTNEWTYFEGIATLGSEATITANNGNGIITPCVNGTVLIDNFKIELLPEFVIESSTIDSVIDKVPVDTTNFTITTTFAINSNTLSNIKINNGATVTATLNAEDEYAFDVTLANLTEGEKYTLDLSGVKDTFGQALTSFEFQIAGFKADGVVELNNLITDPSIESLTATDVYTQDDIRYPELVDDPNGIRGKVIKATAAEGDFMRVEATAATSGLLKKQPWEAGKSYYISFWAKTESGSTKLTLGSHWYNNAPCDTFQTMVTSEWQQHTGLFTFDDDYTGDWARISFLFHSAATIYIDDFNIYELVDMSVVESSLGENTSNVSLDADTIDIVTTLAIDEETIDDVSFSSNLVGFDVELIGENVLRIKNITGLTDDTLYTINLSSVKDIYGQSMATSEFVFRTISYIDISPITFNVSSVAAGDITATTTFTNNSSASENAALVLISYTSGGYIESINVDDFVVEAGANHSFTATVTATDSTDYVVAYVWDWDNIAPWQKEVTLGK